MAQSRPGAKSANRTSAQRSAPPRRSTPSRSTSGRPLQSSLDARNNSASPTFLDRLSPAQKALGGAALVGAVVLGAMALWPSTASASTLPGPGPTPRLPGATGVPGRTSSPSSPSRTSGPSSPSGGNRVYDSERNLRPEGIEAIQRTLRGLGYGESPHNVTCTGVIDAATRAAIRLFQGAYGRDAANHPTWTPQTLEQDGIIGRNTQAALQYYREYMERGGC